MPKLKFCLFQLIDDYMLIKLINILNAKNIVLFKLLIFF